MNEEVDFLELLKFIRRKKLATIFLLVISMIACNIYAYLSHRFTDTVAGLKVEGISLLVSLIVTVFVLLVVLYYFDRSIKSADGLKTNNLLEVVYDSSDIIKVKTKIRLKGQGKVIFLTSPKDLEVEDIIMRLAKEFSKDSKIIVIDSDFRNGKSDQEGYSNLLKNYTDKYKTYIEKYQGIDFLNVGTELDEPEVLLYSDNNKKLLEELQKTYDYIIIYNYNIIDYSDALILSKISNSNYIVVKLYGTQKEDLDKSLEAFKQINSNIDGIIAISEKYVDEDIEE